MSDAPWFGLFLPQLRMSFDVILERTLAAEAGIPVVGVSETPAAGMTYPQWMSAQLEALDRALGAR